MYKVIALNEDNILNYQQLTYPRFRSKITSFNSNIIACGVELESEPIGLILAITYTGCENEKNGLYAQILSIFVVPKYRNQGTGKALFKKLENELKDINCHKVWLTYLENASSVFIEKILQSCSWSEPKAKTVICYANMSEFGLYNAKRNLFQYINHLPSEYSIFLWSTLKEEEREAIKKDIETDEIVKSYNPFVEERSFDPIEPMNSLGLRYQDKIIGWVITHRLNVETIRYSLMFVNPKFQPLMKSIPLLMKAIKIQVEEAPEIAIATFRTSLNNEPMMKFIQHRLSPFLESVRKSWYSFKSL